MGRILDQARADLEADDTTAEVAESIGDTASFSTRDATVMAGGEEVTVTPPSTVQTDEDTGTWLSGSNQYGRPRGTQALENRQIVQTSAMQAIVNGVADQVLGGELTFVEKDDVDADEARVAQLRDLIESVLTGPHLQDVSLDDLITAAIEDMMGPGQAYWQLLGAENADIPVASLIELDPLTIRHNVSKHGVPQDPPYWQAQSAFGGGNVSSLGAVDPTPLQKDQLAVMSYPKGHRSYQQYPISPAWQVREWLEILANSTTHHNRFYADDETSSGVFQIVGASNSTVKDVKEKLEDASGDPRSAAVIGGEGGAQWLELGGQSVNMDIIAEQEWFFYLCLGALGLGKSELGMIEDVNRSNGEVESTRVYKRVAQPFIAQFEEVFLHICRQFDAFNELGEPFKPTIDFSDPREERAKEERLMKRYNNGTLTLEEFYRRTSDGDVVDDDQFVVEIGGEEVNYAEHPQWVAKELVKNAQQEGGGPVGGDGDDDDDGEGLLSLGNVNRGTRTPEGVPEDAHPIDDESECDGQVYEGPQGGLYCVPDESDGGDVDQVVSDEAVSEVAEAIEDVSGEVTSEEAGDRATHEASEQIQNAISKALEDEVDNPDEVVGDIYDNTSSWKQSSYSDTAQTVSRLYAEALNLPGDIRNDGLDGDDPTEDEVKAAQLVTAATRAWAQEKYGEDMDVSRGLSERASDEFVLEWMSDPDAESFDFSENSISNNSVSDDIAAEFADTGAMISRTVGTDELVAAPDLTQPHVSDRPHELEVWTPGAEQELSGSEVVMENNDGERASVDDVPELEELGPNDLDPMVEAFRSINEKYRDDEIDIGKDAAESFIAISDRDLELYDDGVETGPGIQEAAKIGDMLLEDGYGGDE